MIGNLLSIKEAAFRCDCSNATIRRAIDRHELDASKIAGWKIRQEDLEAWVASRRKQKPQPVRRQPKRTQPAAIIPPWEAEIQRKYGNL